MTSTTERLADAIKAERPTLIAAMVEDMKAAYIRGKVEAACFLRDSFRRDGNDSAELACSNFAAIVQVAAGATWEEIHEQGSADLLPRFRDSGSHAEHENGEAG